MNVVRGVPNPSSVSAWPAPDSCRLQTEEAFEFTPNRHTLNTSPRQPTTIMPANVKYYRKISYYQNYQKNVFICILKVELKLLIRFRNTGLVNPTYKPILLQKLDLPDQYYEIVVLTFSCNRVSGCLQTWLYYTDIIIIHKRIHIKYANAKQLVEFDI